MCIRDRFAGVSDRDLAQQQIAEREEKKAHDEEQQTVRQREAQPQAGATPHSRYPAPGSVSMGCGSPSFLRSVITVTRTTLLKGSVFSSQTFSSSSSLDTTPPSAASSTSSTPNSLFC